MNLLDDASSSWTKRPFSISIEEGPKTFAETLELTLISDDEEQSADMKKAIKEIAGGAAAPGMGEGSGSFFSEPSFTDTRVGNCDVMNPYWAFCINDDIIHPLLSTDPYDDQHPSKTGLGRCYSEMYHNNQQTLWLSFGIPQYANLSDFYLNAADSDMARLMNTGNCSIMASLGSFVGTVGKLICSIPFLPFILMNKAADLVSTVSITKYYEFKNTMPLYFQMVNSILAPLAVGLGLIENGTGGASSGGLNEGEQAAQLEEAGIPSVLKDGPDIFSILQRRGKRKVIKGPKTSAEYLEEYKKVANGESSEFLDIFGFKNPNAIGASDFIGFRIEKSTDSSESISNSVGESSILSSLNSAAQSGAEKKFNLMGGQLTGGVLGTMMTGLADFFSGAANAVGMNEMQTLITGNGRYDIPQVWKESSFSKSYSFNFTLRARAGDPVSYYQSILLPLSCILAAALPRSIGKNMYTSPFLCQAFCKGMFNISLGIIESVSIRRGASEFGWTFNNLPTVIEISMNIRDLSPAMFANLGSPTAEWTKIWEANTTFHDYLDTLSGLGVEERYFFLKRLKRKFKTAVNISRTTYGSGAYWSQHFSKWTKLVGNCWSYSAVPPN